MNPKVDNYFALGCGRCPLGGTPECKVHNWTDPMTELRRILLDTELNEEVKWSVPTYTYDGKNILILSAFNDYASVSFFKGALLKDPHNVLIQPTKNTQASRVLRFTDVQTVRDMEIAINDLIQSAIEVEKAGLDLPRKETSDFDFPDELISKFEDDPAFEAAFEQLTPGRQRGYLLHFSGAKQSKTRISRIEKSLPKIFEGKGFHD